MGPSAFKIEFKRRKRLLRPCSAVYLPQVNTSGERRPDEGLCKVQAWVGAAQVGSLWGLTSDIPRCRARRARLSKGQQTLRLTDKADVLHFHL